MKEEGRGNHGGNGRSFGIDWAFNFFNFKIVIVSDMFYSLIM